MILINSYTVNQKTLNVSVEYEYPLTDTVAGGTVIRRASASLSQKVAPLDAPDWTDADLCAALAASINQDPADVAMAEETPMLPTV